MVYSCRKRRSTSWIRFLNGVSVLWYLNNFTRRIICMLYIAKSFHFYRSVSFNSVNFEKWLALIQIKMLLSKLKQTYVSSSNSLAAFMWDSYSSTNYLSEYLFSCIPNWNFQMHFQTLFFIGLAFSCPFFYFYFFALVYSEHYAVRSIALSNVLFTQFRSYFVYFAIFMLFAV